VLVQKKKEENICILPDRGKDEDSTESFTDSQKYKAPAEVAFNSPAYICRSWSCCKSSLRILRNWTT